MIDIHSHIIPNIDDGSKSLDETLQILDEARKAGFTDIVFTPHYFLEVYEPSINKIEFWKDNIKKLLDIRENPICLHIGMEIYITEKIDKLINQNKLLTLANSRYMLVELPLYAKVNYFSYVIDILKKAQIVPIIAHPERYESVQKNIDVVKDFKRKGCVIQCNYGSIIGTYGVKVKSTFEKLLREDLIDVLATDCHQKKSIYTKINKAKEKIVNIIGNEKLNLLSEINPRNIIENKKI